VLSQYKEAFAVVRCSYKGQTYSRCVYIWVDKDFAIARGLHQGYPKKLGSIHQTRPHPYGPAPRIEAGARFGATLAAADRRLAQTVLTLREPSGTNGFVNGHPMAHHRWLPSIEKGKGVALDELIETGAASFEAGQPWVGDAELELFEAPTEELARLEIREPIAAYYRQVGVVWDGGRLLESGTSEAE
jgi:acetoacetate decarboxylase